VGLALAVVYPLAARSPLDARPARAQRAALAALLALGIAASRRSPRGAIR
jgi:hypothetical protein